MESAAIDFEALPEGCVTNVLSLTTPRDACALALVSKIFCSAAGSDVVWDRFLPSDYESIISGSSSSLLDSASSKKDVYFALSNQPIIIDDGRKSFQLDKKSGKKCYTLAARDLFIVWGETPMYWDWTPLPESRFKEVAVLVEVCWLEIRGKISTKMLSSNTQYAAYLVFKLINDYGFSYCPAEVSVGIHGDQTNTRKACLEPNIKEEEYGFMSDEELLGLQHPIERSDGWWEIEMGEFFNSGLEDEQLEMSLLEIKGLNWKAGLILQGIEVRPKLL